MLQIKLCFLVFVSGGCGALCRFLLSEFFNKLAAGHYPLGTFVVNVVGAFLFGVAWELAAGRMLISDAARITICAGFLGSFTTFSSLKKYT